MTAAVLLAAGLGTRMQFGAASKLTLPFGTSTVVGEAARALAAADVFGRIVIVTGHDAARVEAAVRDALGAEGRGLVVVHHAAFAAGQAGSIAAGARAVGDGATTAVCLGDLPLVRPATVRALVAAVQTPDDVVRPVWGRTPGHPVVFGAAHLAALRALAPERDGARALARTARPLALDDPGVAADVDTPADYAAAGTRATGRAI